MHIGTIGNLLLGLASLSAIASIGAYAFGRQGSSDTRKLGHLLTYGVFGFITLSIVLLAVSFLTENWALQYVVMNHPTTVGPWAWVYRLSGVWAGREGSLLFWEWILAIYAAFIARDTSVQTALRAGTCGEWLVLEATRLGLGTCWVAGTFRRAEAEAQQAADSSRWPVSVRHPAPGATGPRYSFEPATVRRRLFSDPPAPAKAGFGPAFSVFPGLPSEGTRFAAAPSGRERTRRRLPGAERGSGQYPAAMNRRGRNFFF